MDEVMSGRENEPATKGDLRAVQGDVQAMRGDIARMRDEVRDLLRPVIVTLAHHTAELADIRGHVKDKMVTREEFHSRMDGFTGRVDVFDYSSAKNRERLDDHAKRISALEEKTA